VGVTAAELGGMLYDSLHDKLLKLPDATLVYPAHGAGSMCGKNLSTDTVSTMEAQRLHNYALQPMSKEEFIGLVTMGQNEAPAYFSYDATLNRQERETLDQSMARSLKGLSLEDVLRLRNQGAQILDVRDAAHYAGAHLADSIHVGLDGKFATWAGTVLDRERPIVVVSEPGREEEAVLRLGRIGFDHVAGFLEGGMLALEERPDLVRRTERITASTLAEQLAGPKPPAVLDVRSPNERQSGAIEGSVHIALNHLRERAGELPQQGPLVIYCASGYRSSIAASILEQAGFKDTQDLVGGFGAWQGVR
jgi:rhodanese-related sulfurtransferase